MNRWIGVLALLLAGMHAAAAAEAPPMAWNEGAEDCAASSQPPLQVQRLDATTYVLRQNPCASFEANFLYLLIGARRALLIDSGAIADPGQMPLATQVMALLPERGGTKLPLIVAHTHGHRDHREGDAQFAGRPGVDIVPPDVDGVRRYYGFDRWPEGVARVALGGRIVEVVPAPGHHPAHVVFFDRATGALFTGDFLLPGRITVDDADAFEASARRLADFVRERPVSQVLGGHVELDRDGDLFPYGATHHPREHPLALEKADVFALAEALPGFNGFQARHANFVLTNPKHNLAALAVGVLAVLMLATWWIVRWRRRRRAARSR